MPNRRHRHALLIGVITLLGFALRLTLLDAHPFREDEAIYSFWALHAWPDDPLFLTVWPDKPPLFIWSLAIVFRIFGAGVVTARWFNIAISTLTIPVVAMTADALWARFPWGRRATWVAALAMALSPYAISFAPTAFTDPLLVLLGGLALLMTLRKRPFWAGLWLGAAIMTKQQGVLYIPLILGLWIADLGLRIWGLRSRDASSLPANPKPQIRNPKSAISYLLLGLAIVALPIVYWDSLRWAVAPSPWDLSARNYGGLALAPPWQWPMRALEWGTLAWELAGSWLVWGGLALLWMIHHWRRISHRRAPEGGQKVNLRTAWRWVLLWSAGFLVFHIVTNVQIWDRYLLPLAPVVALLIGWAVAVAVEDIKPRSQMIALTLSLLLLLPPAWSAAQGRTPIGGDHGAYDGLHEALAWIETNAPDDAILYHRELGWHYQFYLFDQVRDGRYQLRWFPNAITLADNVTKTSLPRKFYIQPAWAPLRDDTRHMDVRGVELVERARFDHMTVYELQVMDVISGTYSVTSNVITPNGP